MRETRKSQQIVEQPEPLPDQPQPGPGLGALAAAVAAVMAEVGVVHKTGKNPHFNYKYASEADLLKALQPLMARHGLVLLPVKVEKQTSEHGKTKTGKTDWRVDVRVTYLLLHAGSGGSVEVQSSGWGVDAEDKAPYKALTGALKYILRPLFLIPTDDDPEAGGESERERAATEKAGGKLYTINRRTAAGGELKDDEIPRAENGGKPQRKGAGTGAGKGAPKVPATPEEVAALVKEAEQFCLQNCGATALDSMGDQEASDHIDAHALEAGSFVDGAGKTVRPKSIDQLAGSRKWLLGALRRLHEGRRDHADSQASNDNQDDLYS